MALGVPILKHFRVHNIYVEHACAGSLEVSKAQNFSIIPRMSYWEFEDLNANMACLDDVA